MTYENHEKSKLGLQSAKTASCGSVDLVVMISLTLHHYDVARKYGDLTRLWQVWVCGDVTRLWLIWVCGDVTSVTGVCMRGSSLESWLMEFDGVGFSNVTEYELLRNFSKFRASTLEMAPCQAQVFNYSHSIGNGKTSDEADCCRMLKHVTYATKQYSVRH